MRGRTNYKRFFGMGAAILLFASLGVGATVFLFAGRWSQPNSSSPPMARAGDQREAQPMVADLVTAIRNADVQVIRQLLQHIDRMIKKE